MSVSPERPERLAEILLEILALSNSTPPSQTECEHDNQPIELLDTDCLKEHSHRKDEEGSNRQNVYGIETE